MADNDLTYASTYYYRPYSGTTTTSTSNSGWWDGYYNPPQAKPVKRTMPKATKPKVAKPKPAEPEVQKDPEPKFWAVRLNSKWVEVRKCKTVPVKRTSSAVYDGVRIEQYNVIGGDVVFTMPMRSYEMLALVTAVPRLSSDSPMICLDKTPKFMEMLTSQDATIKAWRQAYRVEENV